MNYQYLQILWNLSTSKNQLFIIIIHYTQDHTREYFMDKFTAQYCTLPIHTVAYQCEDDRSANCDIIQLYIYAVVVFRCKEEIRSF